MSTHCRLSILAYATSCSLKYVAVSCAAYQPSQQQLFTCPMQLTASFPLAFLRSSAYPPPIGDSKVSWPWSGRRCSKAVELRERVVRRQGIALAKHHDFKVAFDEPSLDRWNSWNFHLMYFCMYDTLSLSDEVRNEPPSRPGSTSSGCFSRINEA